MIVNLLSASLLISILIQVTTTTNAREQFVNKVSGCECRCITFILDDVQDYFLNEPQKEIINTFQETESGITLGIVGNSFGNDTELVTFIRALVTKDNLDKDGSPPLLKIANHGWNHEDFRQFDEREQSSLIRKSNEKIAHVLSTAKPRQFIAPYGFFNNDTFYALKENNITYISTIKKTIPFLIPPFAEDLSTSRTNEIQKPPDNVTIYWIPSTAMTGGLSSDNKSWLSVNHQLVLKEINDSLIKYGFAVVVMHPQDYSIREGLNYKNQPDLHQINELKKVLHTLKSNGLKIVGLDDLKKC
jgi:peptidoglycan/xylan/chitin deacetylase (PgdA/CDA1 family)